MTTNNPETKATTQIAATTKTSISLDRISVTVFVVAWIVMIFRIAPAIDTQHGWVALPAGVLVGYLLADLLAGLVHWFADRFFHRNTPLLGKLLIAPFREHHDDATGITRHDFFEVSGNNALVTTPIVVFVAIFSQWPSATASPVASPLTQFVLIVCASATLFLFLTNLFHRWAHTPTPPTPVRWLQATGLILTPSRHARHHASQHDRAYCVTSGWLNPILDRLRVFERLESLFSSRLHPTPNGSRRVS